MASSPLQSVLFLSLSALLFLSIPVPRVVTVQAQSSTNTSCAASLVPCANYINSTNPPASCCTPLKEAITNDLPCLCAIYADPTILKAFNINLTAAAKLTTYCGIDSSTSQCKGAAPSGTPIPPPPSNGAGSRPVWIGVSGLIGLFSIFWAICA